MGDGGDVGAALHGLYQEIGLDAADGVVAGDLLVAEAIEELPQLFQAVGVGIVKLRQLRDDALRVGIAAVDGAHELHAQAAAPEPGHDGEVLEIHIAVEVFRQRKRAAGVHAALLLAQHQKLDIAAQHPLVDGEAGQQLFAVKFGLEQGIIALQLPMPGGDEF